MYAPCFDETLPALGVWPYVLLASTTLAVVLVFGVLEDRALLLVSRPVVQVAAGAVGTFAIWAYHELLAGSLPLTWTLLACLPFFLVEATSFVTVFFAWVARLRQQCFDVGFEVVTVVFLIAVVLDFLLVQSPVGGGSAAMDSWGLLISGLCLVLEGRLAYRGSNAGHNGETSEEDGCVTGGSDGKRPKSRATTSLLALLGVYFLVLGFISYARYFTDEGAPEDSDVLFDSLLVICLALVSAYVLVKYGRGAVSQGGRDRGRVALRLVLGLVLAAFIVFFISVTALMSQVDAAYQMSRLVRRLSRVMAFLAVLTIVYQRSLPSIRAFAFAFLVPSLVPKPTQMALAAVAPSVFGAISQDYITFSLLSTGFFMTVILVAFCLINIDGWMTRDDMCDSDSLDNDRSDRREAACEAMRHEFGLTKREEDVLYAFSSGMSARDTAMALSVSVSTVNTHSMTLYRKLGIHSRQELVELVDKRLA
jgi:DNA-binding CsgD family transcriptional regulator